MDRWTKKKDQKSAAAKAGSIAPSIKTKEAAPAVTSETKSEIVVAPVSSAVFGVLKYPLVTEKAAVMASQHKYAFVVEKNATKNQVKQAVKEQYKVTPRAVCVINVSGKSKRFGRSVGRRQDFKKAIVTLPAGQSITIHEGV